MDISATFRKSGDRPIIPQLTRAHRVIIPLRRSRSSRVRGMMNDSPTGSPAGRRRIGHLLPRLRVMLQIVQPRDALRTAPQRRMDRRVRNPLPRQINLRRIPPQPLQIIGPRPCRHKATSPLTDGNLPNKTTPPVYTRGRLGAFLQLR